jgi:hypothetical protein
VPPRGLVLLILLLVALAGAATATASGAGQAAAQVQATGLLSPDGDGDGVPDALDNCPAVPNPLQLPAPGTLAGDVCDFVERLCDPLCRIVIDDVPGVLFTVEAERIAPGEQRLFATHSLQDLIDCAEYSELIGATYTVDGTPGVGDKRITVLYSWATVLTRPERDVEVCFSAPYAFVADPAYDSDGAGRPNDWQTAILPDCPARPAQGSDPCVLSRRSLPPGVEVTLRIPGGPKDPRIRG